MATLTFPSGRIVGSLDCLGSWDVRRGPALATGDVVVPDDRSVTLHGQSVTSVAGDGDSSTTRTGREPVHLGFIARWPGDAIDSLHLHRPFVAGSFGAVGHLAPGLRSLYLAGTARADDAVATIAGLSPLVYLQTWGNTLTDAGVQPLMALAELQMLSLKERTLTVAAFGSAGRLRALQRLGLQDVDLTDGELDFPASWWAPDPDGTDRGVRLSRRQGNLAVRHAGTALGPVVGAGPVPPTSTGGGSPIVTQVTPTDGSTRGRGPPRSLRRSAVRA